MWEFHLLDIVVQLFMDNNLANQWTFDTYPRNIHIMQCFVAIATGAVAHKDDLCHDVF